MSENLAPSQPPASSSQILALRDNIGEGTPGTLVPRTLAEAQIFAQTVAHSSLIPSALRERAPDILVILLAGAELGIAPMASLRAFHVIEGVPRLSADGLASIVTASPLCEYFEPILDQCSSTKSVWRTKRRGRPEQINTWTIEQAQVAQLANGKNWIKHPRAMLHARCKAELARLVYPEIAAGMITAEELDLDGNPSGGFASMSFSAPPPPSPELIPVDTKTESKPAKSTAAKNGKSTTKEVIEQAKATEAAQPVVNPAAKAFEEARENTRIADEARKAKAAEQAPPPPVEPAPAPEEAPTQSAADDGGFGDDEPAQPTPADLFKRFLDELSTVTKETINTVKTAWVDLSKPGQPLHAFAPQMRDAFAKRRADLGL
jgi:hypothetical protein